MPEGPRIAPSSAPPPPMPSEWVTIPGALAFARRRGGGDPPSAAPGSGSTDGAAGVRGGGGFGRRAAAAASTSDGLWWPCVLYPSWGSAAKDSGFMAPASGDAGTDAKKEKEASLDSAEDELGRPRLVRIAGCRRPVAAKHLARNLVPERAALRPRRAKHNVSGKKGPRPKQNRVVAHFLGLCGSSSSSSDAANSHRRTSSPTQKSSTSSPSTSTSSHLSSPPMWAAVDMTSLRPYRSDLIDVLRSSENRVARSDWTDLLRAVDEASLALEDRDLTAKEMMKTIRVRKRREKSEEAEERRRKREAEEAESGDHEGSSKELSVTQKQTPEYFVDWGSSGNGTQSQTQTQSQMSQFSQKFGPGAAQSSDSASKNPGDSDAAAAAAADAGAAETDAGADGERVESAAPADEKKTTEETNHRLPETAPTPSSQQHRQHQRPGILLNKSGETTVDRSSSSQPPKSVSIRTPGSEAKKKSRSKTPSSPSRGVVGGAGAGAGDSEKADGIIPGEEEVAKPADGAMAGEHSEESAAHEVGSGKATGGAPDVLEPAKKSMATTTTSEERRTPAPATGRPGATKVSPSPAASATAEAAGRRKDREEEDLSLELADVRKRVFSEAEEVGAGQRGRDDDDVDANARRFAKGVAGAGAVEATATVDSRKRRNGNGDAPKIDGAGAGAGAGGRAEREGGESSPSKRPRVAAAQEESVPPVDDADEGSTTPPRGDGGEPATANADGAPAKSPEGGRSGVGDAVPLPPTRSPPTAETSKPGDAFDGVIRMEVAGSNSEDTSYFDDDEDRGFCMLMTQD